MFPKASIAVLVIAAHACFLGLFDHLRPGDPRWHISLPLESWAAAEIIDQVTAESGAAPVQTGPELAPIGVEPTKVLQFDDSHAGHLTATAAGPAMMPRLSRQQSVNVGEYARRAGIAAGHPLIVVLSVRVDTHGKAGAITILRSCGSSAADVAAVDYARHLRWIPGTVNGALRSMLLVLPVTLDPAGSPLASFQSAPSGSRITRTSAGERCPTVPRLSTGLDRQTSYWGDRNEYSNRGRPA